MQESNALILITERKVFSKHVSNKKILIEHILYVAMSILLRETD